MDEELIKSAVSFLRDPQVASSPLTKKVEFLESKGLNQSEIEEALRRANEGTNSQVATTTTASPTATTTTTSVVSPSQPNLPPIDYYNAPPPPPERSWKDYFIMATATAGVMYGLHQVVTKYLIPTIIPPSQSAIEKDKERIDEEFLKIDKILEQLTEDQQNIKNENEIKLKDIDTVIENVNDFLSRYNKDKLKFDDDLRLMKLEIDNLSNSIQKNMKLTKEDINEELSDINQELQSLKNLIKARGSTSTGNNQSNGGIERKIAPASSIPSASEILKRAKAASASKVEDKSSSKESTPEIVEKKEQSQSPLAQHVEPVNQSSDRVGAITVGGVTAGGIPAWQLRDKEREEKEEAVKKIGTPEASSPVVATAVSPTVGSGIPAWQMNNSTGGMDAKSEEVIKDKIASIGVPSWQLNSAANPQ
ncbi:PEX14 [[Candida] subhashii]|uniref:Peroxisomal membrane protein PEX14 n=1 Tax=[Candida] subhashii TaxID=561895 RepID=A0A8J5UKN1_9ASCO|nr:PEX14 [[Candida] subhashii]KAG7662072.1 PEX14 [[Candida] subhashii]